MKLVSSDLEKTSSTYSSYLQYLYAICSNISSAIDSFNSNSSKRLSGEGYDAIRDRLSSYKTMFNKMKELIVLLDSNIKSANDSLLMYMNGNAELSDDYVNEISGHMYRVKSLRDQYYTEMLQEGDPEIKNIKQYLYKKYSDMYDEINHIIKLIERLPDAVNRSYGMLGDSISGTNKCVSVINSISGIKG